MATSRIDEWHQDRIAEQPQMRQRAAARFSSRVQSPAGARMVDRTELDPVQQPVEQDELEQDVVSEPVKAKRARKVIVADTEGVSVK